MWCLRTCIQQEKPAQKQKWKFACSHNKNSFTSFGSWNLSDCKLLVQFSQWCSVCEHLRLESLVTLWKSTLPFLPHTSTELAYWSFPCFLRFRLTIHICLREQNNPATMAWWRSAWWNPLLSKYCLYSLSMLTSCEWNTWKFFFFFFFPVDFIVLGLLTELRLSGRSRSYRGSILSRHLCKCNYCHGETAWLDHSSLWYLRLWILQCCTIYLTYVLNESRLFRLWILR